jgi:hypothetical protein
MKDETLKKCQCGNLTVRTHEGHPMCYICFCRLYQSKMQQGKGKEVVSGDKASSTAEKLSIPK